ncbi:MAG: CDP-alcohol phosphatidyltransferase family protein [Bacilli bacterium]|nr:CDP-alcohol phosphatidyltransferase family protein [Bacilli bacterium]
MKEKIKKVLPNIITLSRVIALVIGFILFLKEKIVMSICLYIYGSISDALDGYLARKWNAYTKLGGYLDATSDKLYALSIIVISVMYGNYLILIVSILEIIISIINYLVIRKNGSAHTERVGKFKMTLEFILLITSLIMIKIKHLWYLYVVMLILTVYFQLQCINAYINQKNNKKQGLEIDYTGKSFKEKSKLLLYEFKYYLMHPVKIIK